jgi:hypothetical protein
MLISSTKHWPLLVIVIPRRLDAAAVAEFTACIDACYERHEHFASLIDMSLLERPPDALLRRTLTDWAASHLVEMKRYSTATAMVVTNTLVRGALTAVQWVVASPRPIHLVSTPHEGTTLLLDALDRAGVTVHPSVLAYHASLVGCHTAPVEPDAARPSKRG